MKMGWEMKRFAEVLEIHNGKNQRDVLSDSGTYPIYGSAGKVMGMATDFICKAGTTIIGRKGNINSPVFTDTPFWNVDTAFGLSALNELDSKFLFYFCLTYDFSALNRGTTIPSLVKSELLEIEMPVPPVPKRAV
ncbi:MAG: restriction endonuclease subunit S [Verrucomicrobiota bacterium]|nr:restriction endonuclease subunit S [Verrucomicrobiota bacterium]